LNRGRPDGSIDNAFFRGGSDVDGPGLSRFIVMEVDFKYASKYSVYRHEKNGLNTSRVRRDVGCYGVDGDCEWNEGAVGMRMQALVAN